MKGKLIYIAGPYTVGDMAANVARALDAANALADQGALPFVPQLTHFWHLHSQRPYEWWLGYDLAWLKLCDGLLRIPGESLGADREVEYAARHGIPWALEIPELKRAIARLA